MVVAASAGGCVPFQPSCLLIYVVYSFLSLLRSLQVANSFSRSVCSLSVLPIACINHRQNLINKRKEYRERKIKNK